MKRNAQFGNARVSWETSRTLAFCCLACIAFVSASGWVRGQAREGDVKAALLFNLTQFVEWPAEAFATPGSPIVIAVIGRDPFGRTLDDLVQPVTVKGRRIVVERRTSFSRGDTTHVLFVPGNRESVWPQIASEIRAQPILTVADFPRFASRGGMVEIFRTREDTLRLRVNLTAARAAGMTISAKLLRVAEVMEAEGPR